MADLPCDKWANKKGTSDRSCSCGSWKDHWLQNSGLNWPAACSVSGCSSKPVLGAHIYNSDVSGEKIAPFCDSCIKKDGKFSLKGGVRLVSANKQNTCD